MEVGKEISEIIQGNSSIPVKVDYQGKSTGKRE
jgi:hypothetical protein